SEGHVMNSIAFDHDARAAVDIDAVGARAFTISRIFRWGDVIDQILIHNSVARAVYGWIWSSVLKTNDVDSNVAIAVDAISGYAKMRYVAVEGQRFTVAGLKVVYFVSGNHEIGEGGEVGAVNGDSETIGSSAGAVTAWGGLLNIVHIVVQQLDVRTMSVDADAAGHALSI